MSAAAKTRLTKIEITEEGKKTSYFLPKATASAIVSVIRQYVIKDEAYVLAEEMFPELADPVKRTGISLRGVRRRLNLTQKEMAEKIGVTQGDLSKMEKGLRPIGRKLALRIGKALKIDYRRLL